MMMHDCKRGICPCKGLCYNSATEFWNLWKPPKITHANLHCSNKSNATRMSTNRRSPTSLAWLLGRSTGILKRLVAKGYVKVQRAERKKLRYIITPEGIALRARLTVDYIERSFDLYRQDTSPHQRASGCRQGGRFQPGPDSIGEGDVADICKLSCLEQGFTVVQDDDAPAA